MILKRTFDRLGGADHGWLKARHHFSFANYYDPNNMGWGALRVWNDDEIQPRTGFPPHPHADMEIITYVREGAVSHQDSMGNQGRTAAGDTHAVPGGNRSFQPAEGAGVCRRGVTPAQKHVRLPLRVRRRSGA